MKLRRLNADLHRDIGYFLSGLIFIYCLSGIALNHVDDWNSDFIIHKRTITLDRTFTQGDITEQRIAEFSAMVGETTPKVHDFPTPEHVKLYYDDASLLVDLTARSGAYESVRRRPFFYQSNALHRNSLKGWRWASDVFAVLLLFVTVSGWFMLKGRNGIGGRGKWLLIAGILPPVAAVVIFEFLQK